MAALQHCYICSRGAYWFPFDQYTSPQALLPKYKLFVYADQYLHLDVLASIKQSRRHQAHHKFTDRPPLSRIGAPIALAATRGLL